VQQTIHKATKQYHPYSTPWPTRDSQKNNQHFFHQPSTQKLALVIATSVYWWAIWKPLSFFLWNKLISPVAVTSTTPSRLNLLQSCSSFLPGVPLGPLAMRTASAQFQVPSRVPCACDVMPVDIPAAPFTVVDQLQPIWMKTDLYMWTYYKGKISSIQEM
jgi:hypothetical protein